MNYIGILTEYEQILIGNPEGIFTNVSSSCPKQ